MVVKRTKSNKALSFKLRTLGHISNQKKRNEDDEIQDTKRGENNICKL